MKGTATFTGRCAAILLLSVPGTVLADIYGYTDAAGVRHFTNTPQDNRYTLVVAVQRESGGSGTALLPPPVVKAEDRQRFGTLVNDAALAHQVDAALVHAVISAESGYNPRAVSKKGATGLMQLMPDTARRYGVVDAFDPAQNIRGGTQYLRDLLKMFDNNMELAIAAYNAGEKAVVRYGNQIPPYRETLNYVPRVLKYYQKYQSASR